MVCSHSVSKCLFNSTALFSNDIPVTPPQIEYDTGLAEFYGGIPLIKRQSLPQGLVSEEWKLAFRQTLFATSTTQVEFYQSRPDDETNRITNISQYGEIYNFFMNNYGTSLPDSAKPQGFWSRDNTTDPRLSVDERWNNDDVFSQSRLMGVNPVEIERVSESESVGMEWKSLEAMLNSTFNWNEAVSAVIPDGNSIKQVWIWMKDNTKRQKKVSPGL